MSAVVTRIRCYGSTLFITEADNGALLISDGPISFTVPAESRQALAEGLVDPAPVNPVIRIGNVNAWVNVAALTRVRSLILGAWIFCIDVEGAERLAALLLGKGGAA